MSNRNLDSDWSYEQDTALFAMREENPTPNFGTIARRLTRQFGTHRTVAATVGRYSRILKDSEEALAAATRKVKAKTHSDRVREVRDPYHPLPEWFKTPTPVETNRARNFDYENTALLAAGAPTSVGAVSATNDRIAQIRREMIIDRAEEANQLPPFKPARVRTWTPEAKEARRLKRWQATEAEVLTRREADRIRHQEARAREAERRAALPAHDSSLYLGIVPEVVQPRPVRRRQPQKAIGLDRVAAEALPEPEQDETLIVVSVPKASSRHYRPSWTD